MAINFEAANMAGYNNPKIEVFEAVYPDEGATLIEFPRKSVILDCIKRGAVPILVATDAARTEMYILYLGTIASTINEKYLLSFSNTSKPTATDPPIIVTVHYEFDSETPTITFEPVTVSNL